MSKYTIKNTRSYNSNNDETSEYSSIIDDSQMSGSNINNSNKIKSILKNKNRLFMLKGSTRTINNNPISGRETTASTIFTPKINNKFDFENKNCLSDNDIIHNIETSIITNDKLKKNKSESTLLNK
jgi:hypothetical protein